MATYVLPQVLVFQEFNIVPAAVANPLRSHITGPHAQLLRYNETDEQAKGFLGYYDNLLPQPHAWPHRPAGGIVDATYTKVWVKDALLQYFTTFIGGGHMVTKMASYGNRIHSTNLNFAENGIYVRSNEFLDRDVQPGDVVKVRGLDNTLSPVTLWTYVKALHGDQIASSVLAAANDVNNKPTQSYSASYTKVSGPDNAIILIPDGTAYDGLASGYITETYDIIVTETSVSSDLTKGKIRIISGSGTDDILSVVPNGMNVPTPIGTRGLTVTFDSSGSGGDSISAIGDGVLPADIVVGQRWRVTVNQLFTAPSATSGGTYTGLNDTTYIVVVNRGGTYPNDPQINITTTNGIDISGPIVVPASATAVPIGTLGATIMFSGVALRTGDRFYVPVLSAAEGPIKAIELGQNLPSAIPAGNELDLTLFIRKPVLQIEKNRIGSAPLTNWDQTAEQITINDGIQAFDATWTNSGVPVALPLSSEASKQYGQVYVEYRAWLSDLCNEVFTINDVGTINDQISGALHPDNPLKWGVFKALENANGTDVKFSSVCNPADVSSWADVLGILIGRDDVYGLVPLTKNRTVQDLWAAHVDDQSVATAALWRVTWFNLMGVPLIPIVSSGSTVANHLTATTTDGDVCLCVVEQDPFFIGSSFTILRCTSDNGGFITNNVRPGDIVRTEYTGDGFGNYSYTEFVVDVVTAEDQLRLLVGPSGPLSVGAKTEIWRHLSAGEESQEIALSAGSWGDRRIRAVWPDQIESAGTIMDGTFLCCSLAALSGGVLPHQGLTHLEITGYSNVDRTTAKFNKAQLDAMALAGTWIVTQDPIVGTIFTRHAVTTALNSDINKREEMITRNVDSISYRFKDTFAPFIGVTNVTPGTVSRIRLDTNTLINVLKIESSTKLLGGQLIDGTVIDVHQHPTLKDRIVVNLSLVVPYALNNIEIHLTF